MLNIDLRYDDGIVSPRLEQYSDRQACDWELALHEIHHRMKNTLTLLAASARLGFAAGAVGQPAALDRFERRVVAFGRLYHILSSGGGERTVAVAGFFENLCGALMEAILEPIGIHCELTVEDGTLPERQCNRLGLIVAELVTNAAKHAFRGEFGGLIRVEALTRNRSLHCTVSDNGVGMTGSAQGTGGKSWKTSPEAFGQRCMVEQATMGHR